MLVNDMVDEVRALADEDATSDITDASIMASLNRGQQQLVRIATRVRNDLFMRELELSASDFTAGEATITPLAQAGIINHIHLMIGDTPYRMTKRELSKEDVINYPNTVGGYPRYWCVRGNKLLVFPALSGSATLKVRYQLRPPTLVISEGRIHNYTSTTLTLDAIGSNLTTDVSNLLAFIAIVDSQTGLVKGRAQVSAINTTTKVVTIKTASLDRTSVFGYDVDTAMPTDLAKDDYVCLANGTCIPTLTRDYSDYLIQFAVVETMRRLGVPSQEAFARLKDLEKDLEKMWAGQPQMQRIRNSSSAWTI